MHTGVTLWFTGLTAPYEEPLSPEIIVDTEQHTEDQSTELILAYLIEHGYIY
ncbi:adenylyl-sulfate kinase [Paenibacillus sp. FSL R7-0204]|uniref:adenylyl-sulfate kinase n=1 Tax=Paenibacillus sp. FSL R7-0204 TaxID=2921675 RepID=UPI0030F5CDC2